MVLINNCTERMGVVSSCARCCLNERPALWRQTAYETSNSIPLVDHENTGAGTEARAESGVEPNYHAENGRVITRDLKFKLIEAGSKGDVGIFKKHKDLIDERYITDYYMRTPLHLAAAEGHLSVVKYLIEELHNEPEWRDRNKRTAYDEAVKGNHVEVAEYLQSKMCHSRSTEKHEIIEAASRGDLEFLKSKRNQDVNMSFTNYDRRTPLHLAATEGHTDVVKFLLKECNVDATVKDRYGQTAADDARQNRHYEIEDIIRKH